MAMKLTQNQINALVHGRKSEIEKYVTEAYKTLQHQHLFNGRTRVYEPDNDDGEKLPAETQTVQKTVVQITKDAVAKWTDLWNCVLTQDVGNQNARADIEIDGVIICPQVPVTNLLFMLKQLDNVHAFVNHMPTPDPAEDWSYDSAIGILRLKTPKETIRTVKKPASFEKSPATDKHPAQVEFYYADERVGVWKQLLYCSGIQMDRKIDILGRIAKMKDAVKLALERANTIVVEKQSIGEKIFGYVFGDFIK